MKWLAAGWSGCDWAFTRSWAVGVDALPAESGSSRPLSSGTGDISAMGDCSSVISSSIEFNSLLCWNLGLNYRTRHCQSYAAWPWSKSANIPLATSSIPQHPWRPFLLYSLHSSYSSVPSILCYKASWSVSPSSAINSLHPFRQSVLSPWLSLLFLWIGIFRNLYLLYQDVLPVVFIFPRVRGLRLLHPAAVSWIPYSWIDRHEGWMDPDKKFR